MKKLPIILTVLLGSIHLTFGQSQVISDNAQDLSILKLKNATWACNQTTALEFWNGSNKNYATSRIVSKMDGCGAQGEALIFETETAGDSAPSAKMIIKNNGNVGIGNINPSTKLDIFDTNADLSIMKLRNGKWTCNQRTSIEFWNGGLKNHPTSRIVSQMDGCGTQGEALLFETQTAGETNPSAKMTIKNDGNIGIGTLNPNGWKLAVNGKIRAKEIKIETGWSDFVFYDDYKLPTLQDVENHIKENGHLKDIPSAKEVEENGIYLGEMDSKLLQKIEELTLYTIQQEKQLDKQSKEISELKILVQKLLKSKK
ncbi:hypothetical protein [Aquimarina algiphila]|uniref:hypothetical protein n=1 Tax=Aquimarina algiphila TaxID=2047982 RepID=UPI00232C4A45|nr:hypothetical protein [Aquimarina algiphila]